MSWRLWWAEIEGRTEFVDDYPTEAAAREAVANMLEAIIVMHASEYPGEPVVLHGDFHIEPID